MSVNLSNTTYPPRSSIRKDVIYRKKESDDSMSNYRQIQIDGINYEEEIWDVEWIPLAPATARALETILRDSLKGSSNYLYWEGFGIKTSKYYTASNLNRSIVAKDLVIVTATLRREFSL